MEREQLKKKSLTDLRDIAKALGLKSTTKYKKDELVSWIMQESEEDTTVSPEEIVEVVETAVVSENAGEGVLIGITAEFDERSVIEDYEKRYNDEVVIATPPTPPSPKQSTSKSELPTEASQVTGILEIIEDYGFLRCRNYLPSDRDIYVATTFIKRFNLRTGDKIVGKFRPQRQDEKQPSLIYIDTVNGDRVRPGGYRQRFDYLTPCNPTEVLHLAEHGSDASLRMIDLISPVGKGQRGLIVAPPKTGKTILLQKIAKSIRKNHPEVEVIILLIDERPEEVTDMQRSIDADVVYSTFDELPSHHIRVAEMVLQRAKALVECKKDVVILLDSITRLARAYNLIIPPSGRTLSGGFDPAALHKPKRFFGAARKTEEAGSLTILATALIETGSKMDEVIFEEFKGTGNMELTLNRKLSERRIFPAIDMRRSGTRKEELLMDAETLEAVWHIRKTLHSPSGGQDPAEMMLEQLLKTKDNETFVQMIRKTMIKE